LKEIRYPGFFSGLPFQFLHKPDQHIELNGKTILYQYPEYRDEQKKFQKNAHYGELYNKRDVFDTLGFSNWFL
jgi:hypothetical protein